jgi:amino acid transporter
MHALAQPSTTRPEEGLDRAIGPFSLGANAVNLAVGAGVFALPAAVAALLGPAAIVAYLACGVTITCVLLCCAELGSVTTRSGGVMAYTQDAFGPLAGFLAWAIYAIGCCALADAAIAHVLMDAIASGVTPLQNGLPRVAGFAVLFATFAAVNVRGVRYGSGLSVMSTLAKLAPLILLIGVGLPAIDWAELRWMSWPSYTAIGQASLLVFFIFMSAEGALTASGEIRDPARTVPRAMSGTAITLVVLYVALQIVSQGVLGESLARQDRAPLASVADYLMGAPGRTLLLACTAIAVFGSVAADMVNTPRAFFAVANEGLLPARLTLVHKKFHTPHIAIMVYATMVFVFTISGAFRPLAVLATISQLLVYFVVCIGVLRLRHLRGSVSGGFRTPGGPVVPLIGAAAVVWLLSHSTAAEVAAIAVMLVAASVYYVMRTRLLRVKSQV